MVTEEVPKTSNPDTLLIGDVNEVFEIVMEVPLIMKTELVGKDFVVIEPLKWLVEMFRASRLV